jgi:hypothetical protein
MIKLKDILTEIEVTPPMQWKDYNLNTIDPQGKETIWSMYKDTYEKEGLDLSANSAQELASKYKAINLMDVDSDKEPDAFIIYKPTSYGNKIALLGTNGKREAKKQLVMKVIKLVNTKGWFIEASKKMETLMKQSNAPVVRDPNMITTIVGKHKNPEIKNDGYFTRLLSKVNKRITKRIYGKPNLSKSA